MPAVIRTISQLAPQRINPRVLGDKAKGCALLHAARPHIPTPYIPVDGFVVPANVDPTQYRQQTFEAFRAATLDLKQPAVFMVRGSQPQELHGETLSLHSLADPTDLDASFQAFFNNVLQVHDQESFTAVIGQPMVGKLENDNDIGRSNVTFYAYLPHCRASGHILLEMAQGLNFQTLAQQGKTSVLFLERGSHRLLGYNIFRGQYNRNYNNPNQDTIFTFSVDGKHFELKQHPFTYKQLRHIFYFPGFTNDSSITFQGRFILPQQGVHNIAAVTEDLHGFIGFPVEIEGTELDGEVYLYQLGQRKLDPVINLEISRNLAKPSIYSNDVRGIWNGVVNLFVFPDIQRTHIENNAIAKALKVLKKRYSDLPTGVFAELPLIFSGEDRFIKDLVVFACKNQYSPAQHIPNRVMQLREKGQEITFMQGARLPVFFRRYAQETTKLFGLEIMIIRNVQVESNGSEAQLVF